METVYIRKAAYDYQALQPVMFSLMDALGGEAIRGDSRVLIKPNLLAAAPPESAVVTHPYIIKAAAEYVIRKGARPVIGDSRAGAISRDQRRIHFDYDECIRCYCCIEVCPHGALSAQESITGRVIRRFVKS